jgi:Meiotically up-regulated gene 113
MTRRLEPKERVHELCSASVPFPFDIHMMISCNDAPSLENALHRAFQKRRVNRANPRKEFFKVSLQDIHKVVTENHGEVQYVADAEALEYRQSISMTDEDSEFIDNVYGALPEEQDEEPFDDEA